MKRVKLCIAFFLLVTLSVLSQNKKYNTYKVLEGETVKSIAQKFSITPYNLLKLNPELNNEKILDAGKILIVPNKDYNPAEAIVESGKDYVENGFLIHKVLPQENFYRLKKEFGVSKRVLRKYNAVLRVEDLKAGQMIKFPVPKNYKGDNQTQTVITTKPYLVRPRETKHSISRRYGITIEKLEELNPTTKDEGLKMGAIISVPDTEEIPDAQDGFLMHRIEKGETFFSLGQLFEISEEKLIAINPELKEGVKEGLFIKIPKILSKMSTDAFVPTIIPNKEIKAILMLPFMSHKSKTDFAKNRRADVATDFYLGAMMALDSVKKQGLSVDMKVFDTQNSKTKLSSLLASGNLSKADVMIGPLFFGNVEFVSNLLKNKEVAIVSPISQKNHAPLLNNKLIQGAASEEKKIDKIVSYIKSNYNGENLLIVTDTAKASVPKVKKVMSTLQSLDSLQKITVLKPRKGYIKRDLFLKSVKKEKDNSIILITNDAIVTTDVLQNLGALPKKVKATLFSFNKGSNFKNVSNDDLSRVNFHYAVSNYVDKEDENVQRFITSYKLKNYAEPSEFAFRGFDVTYDILLRLATYEDVTSALNAGYSKRGSLKFEYTNNGIGKGFSNKGVHLLKYDGYTIVKVEEEMTSEEE